jgi:hypothetical protein
MPFPWSAHLTAGALFQVGGYRTSGRDSGAWAGKRKGRRNGRPLVALLAIAD